MACVALNLGSVAIIPDKPAQLGPERALLALCCGLSFGMDGNTLPASATQVSSLLYLPTDVWTQIGEYLIATELLRLYLSGDAVLRAVLRTATRTLVFEKIGRYLDCSAYLRVTSIFTSVKSISISSISIYQAAIWPIDWAGLVSPLTTLRLGFCPSIAVMFAEGIRLSTLFPTLIHLSLRDTSLSTFPRTIALDDLPPNLQSLVLDSEQYNYAAQDLNFLPATLTHCQITLEAIGQANDVVLPSLQFLELTLRCSGLDLRKLPPTVTHLHLRVHMSNGILPNVASNDWNILFPFLKSLSITGLITPMNYVNLNNMPSTLEKIDVHMLLNDTEDQLLLETTTRRAAFLTQIPVNLHLPRHHWSYLTKLDSAKWSLDIEAGDTLPPNLKWLRVRNIQDISVLPPQLSTLECDGYECNGVVRRNEMVEALGGRNKVFPKMPASLTKLRVQRNYLTEAHIMALPMSLTSLSGRIDDDVAFRALRRLESLLEVDNMHHSLHLSSADSIPRSLTSYTTHQIGGTMEAFKTGMEKLVHLTTLSIGVTVGGVLPIEILYHLPPNLTSLSVACLSRPIHQRDLLSLPRSLLLLRVDYSTASWVTTSSALRSSGGLAVAGDDTTEISVSPENGLATDSYAPFFSYLPPNLTFLRFPAPSEHRDVTVPSLPKFISFLKIDPELPSQYFALRPPLASQVTSAKIALRASVNSAGAAKTDR